MIHPSDTQRLRRIFLLAMDEVLGKDDVDSVLETMSSFPRSLTSGQVRASLVEGHETAADPASESQASLSRLLGAIGQLYGSQVGRGISLRIGRACFHHGLREFGGSLGMAEPTFRLRPFPQRLRDTAAAVADLLTPASAGDIFLEEHAGEVILHIGRCGEKPAQEPFCDLALGLAQEALYWLSGGKIFSVEEVACTARADTACSLRIDPVPLS
jgi:hypothetical protein